MTEPTVAAGFANALMNLAVSKGASQQLLMERSLIDHDALLDQDARIPLVNYMALMKAATELCNEPALALHFGEAFSMSELSIVGLICQSAETAAEGLAQMNRYANLIVDFDETGAGDRFVLIRNEHGSWMALNGDAYVNFPQLTESAFARCVCESARFWGQSFCKSNSCYP